MDDGEYLHKMEVNIIKRCIGYSFWNVVYSTYSFIRTSEINLSDWGNKFVLRISLFRRDILHIASGCQPEKKSIKRLACNWESQKMKAFSHAVDVFNAAEDLEGAVSLPVGRFPRKLLKFCSKIRLETELSKQIFMHIKSW